MFHVYVHRYKGFEGQGPQLYRILGTDGMLIGYFFSPVSSTSVWPEGKNYSMEPVTELDVRDRAYPWWRTPRSSRDHDFGR